MLANELVCCFESLLKIQNSTQVNSQSQSNKEHFRSTHHITYYQAFDIKCMMSYYTKVHDVLLFAALYQALS